VKIVRLAVDYKSTASWNHAPFRWIRLFQKDDHPEMPMIEIIV